MPPPLDSDSDEGDEEGNLDEAPPAGEDCSDEEEEEDFTDVDEDETIREAGGENLAEQ